MSGSTCPVHLRAEGRDDVRVSVPAADYREALTTFDRDLMTAMRQRVPAFDDAGLRQQHEDRATWLARALTRSVETDWDAVRAGARRLLGAS